MRRSDGGCLRRNDRSSFRWYSRRNDRSSFGWYNNDRSGFRRYNNNWSFLGRRHRGDDDDGSFGSSGRLWYSHTIVGPTRCPKVSKSVLCLGETEIASHVVVEIDVAEGEGGSGSSGKALGGPIDAINAATAGVEHIESIESTKQHFLWRIYIVDSQSSVFLGIAIGSQNNVTLGGNQEDGSDPESVLLVVGKGPTSQIDALGSIVVEFKPLSDDVVNLRGIAHNLCNNDLTLGHRNHHHIGGTKQEHTQILQAAAALGETRTTSHGCCCWRR